MTHRWVSRRVLPATLVAATLLVGGCSPDEYVAPPPVQGSEVADPAAAAATVATLQESLDDPEAAAALGSGDEGADLLRAVAENAAALRLSDVTLRYVTETGRTSGADAWDGLVAITWRLEGLDTASSRVEVPVSFAEGGAKIAAIGATGSRLPLWLAGPLTVRRTPGAVVLAGAPATEVDKYARWAARAVRAVRSQLGARGGLVVEIPGDTEALHRALDADPGTYDAIAAVTASVDGSQAAGSPVHVFVNPAVYDDLDPVAGQVVMTHEAVHAVTGATFARGAPLWLLEGFADHMALRDVDLPASRTAAQIIKQVQRDGLPETLPADSALNPASPHLGAAYEGAWQVTETLVERGGEDALVAFYQAVLDGTTVDTGLRRSFDWSVAQLTRAWRSRLAALADVPE